MKLKLITREIFTIGILLLAIFIAAIIVILLSATNYFKTVQFYVLIVVASIMLILMITVFVLVGQLDAERKKSAQKISQANRLYFFISQVNQLIVRTTDEHTLFKEVCRIAVEVGKFRMAWVGLIDEKTNQLSPVLYSDEDQNFLSRNNIALIGETPGSSDPAVKAISEGKYVLCNDIEKAQEMVPWKDAAVSRGFLSSISLPIKKGGKVAGAFTLYAPTVHFFNQEEIELLLETTADISFALEVFEKEKLRKNAEQDFQNSQRRYQTLTESSPVGIFHTDASGSTTYVNPRWCQITGLTVEDAVGDGWLKSVDEHDRDHIAKAWAEASKTQDPSTAEYRFKRPDGKIAWVLGQAIPEINSDNKVVGYIGTTTDITERKKAEEDIAKEKRLSDSIVNSLPGVFYLYNREGKFLRWNKNFETISKFKEKEIPQLHPFDFFDEKDKEQVREIIEQTFENGEASIQIDLMVNQDLRIPYYFTGRAIDYEGSLCVTGVGIDFSERVKAQQQINETTEQLRHLTTHLQTVREEERKRIGREIHDDLGQQLTAIKMDVAWIDKNISEEKVALKRKLKNIIELLDGSNLSIRRILSELRPVILDNHELLEAMDWMGRQIAADSSIVVQFTSTEIKIQPDEVLATCIFRVYQEALTNILRYAGPCKVLTSLEIEGDLIHFKIEDNGCGFDPALVQRNKSFGTLGMKERVLSLGGSFDLKSSPGNGTKILIYLPYKISK